MQIKTTTRFHLTPVRMAVIKKTTGGLWWLRLIILATWEAEMRRISV
jgi:hypothetical protein